MINETMKFGKNLKQQRVPEWAEAYVDYNGLKRILHEVGKFKQSKQPGNPSRVSRQLSIKLRDLSSFRLRDNGHRNERDIESQVIDVRAVEQENCRKLYKTKLLVSQKEGAENETLFFKKLDEELNKTNSFYKDKVEEVMNEATLLEKQMEALIALRIKVMEEESLECLTSDINNSAPSTSDNGGEIDYLCMMPFAKWKACHHSLDTPYTVD